MDWSFEEKENTAKEALCQALEISERSCVGFSGGKKSVVAMHLARQVLGKYPVALHVDTLHENENVGSFRFKMSRLWQFKVISARPRMLIANPLNRAECCKCMIGATLSDASKANGFDLIITGCTNEDQSKCPGGDIATGPAVVNPLGEFTVGDIWEYIKKYKLPKCSLYDQGYETIDCKPCMSAQPSPELQAGTPEEEQIREKLKKLGYL